MAWSGRLPMRDKAPHCHFYQRVHPRPPDRAPGSALLSLRYSQFPDRLIRHLPQSYLWHGFRLNLLRIMLPQSRLVPKRWQRRQRSVATSIHRLYAGRVSAPNIIRPVLLRRSEQTQRVSVLYLMFQAAFALLSASSGCGKAKPESLCQ